MTAYKHSRELNIVASYAVILDDPLTLANMGLAIINAFGGVPPAPPES